LIPQAHRLAGREELGKKGLGELIPCGDGSRWQKVKPCPHFISKREGKQAEAVHIIGGAIDLQWFANL